MSKPTFLEEMGNAEMSRVEMLGPPLFSGELQERLLQETVADTLDEIDGLLMPLVGAEQ